MLQKLSIQNYAIIDLLEINFSPRFNIITGETGAGKSILMGALSLILGDRADTSSLRNKNSKCCVEGFFKPGGREDIARFLEINDIDNDDELVLRREIAATGKSRAFINDTPVNLQQLRALAAMLVDLHRQFDTLELGETGFQREVLDALAENRNILQQYQSVFSQWQKCRSELQEMVIKKNNFLKDYDYNKFLFDELEQASLKENEIEEAEKEIKILSNAGDIKNASSKIYFELRESDTPLLPLLKQLANSRSAYTQYHSGLQDIIERLSGVQIELADIAGETEHINSSIQYDEEKINELNEKINLGYKLLKKHNVQSTAELLQIKESLEIKLQDVLQIDEMIAAKEKETASLFDKAGQIAGDISAARIKAAAPFEKNVNHLLKNVGMPNAAVKVQVSPASINEWGKDHIEFLFDANTTATAGNNLLPLSKVASGGELSRLMLCIKSLVAEKIDLPTLIFDEIDTGISGEAAKKTGAIMKQLSSKRQVISITHQPQIAGRADAHFFVYKIIKDDAVQTSIRLLSEEERIYTIAQMLSGEKPTAAALENAREMIMN